MRALSLVGPGSVRTIEVPPPTAAADEVLVAPRYVGLCGTDLELFAGTMPYFAQGVASYPIQPGHEVAAVVASPASELEVGAAVVIDPVVGCGDCPACTTGWQTRCPRRRELGIRLGMPGGAAELVAVPRRNLHLVPDGLSLRAAVLTEPGVTVLHAIERLGETAERRALVIGAGTLGLIAAELLHSSGADVDVLLIDSRRRELVEGLGLKAVATADEGGYDVVLEAAGTSAAVKTAFAAAAPGGTVAIMGVQPGPVAAFALNDLVLKDLTAHGVLNGPGRYPAMLETLHSGAIHTNALIEKVFPIDQAEEAFSLLANPERRAPKVLLKLAGSSLE